MTLKNILEKITEWMTMNQKEKISEDRKPAFTFRLNDIPGMSNNNQYFIDYPNFILFTSRYEFDDNFKQVFEVIDEQAAEFLMANLEPFIVWDIVKGTIGVTSKERLSGYFIQ